MLPPVSAARLVPGTLVLLLLLASCEPQTRVFSTATPTVPPPTAPPSSAPPTARPTTPPPSRTASPSPSPSPSPTATATTRPTETPGSTGALPPMPAQPSLPSGAAVAASGSIVFSVGAGRSYLVEPSDLAGRQGRTAPPCGSLVWTAAWRASQPLVATLYDARSRSDLGRGRWGTVDSGCSGLELRNDGAASADAELVFSVGSR